MVLCDMELAEYAAKSWSVVSETGSVGGIPAAAQNWKKLLMPAV